jgi:HEAT repeat protein
MPFMRKFTLSLFALLISTNLNPLRAGEVDDHSADQPQAAAIVEQMRGLSMQPSSLPRISDGKIDPEQQRRIEIERQLRLIGKDAVHALAKALKDPEVQMRRKSAAVLITLAGAYEDEQPRPEKLDIREAIPALINALEDSDGEVRSWAAQALGEVGPDAKDAVPALLKLITDSEEGCRNSSCIALAHIGPPAKDALPALRKALKDPSKDVRQFAKRAIDQIQKK